MSASRKDSAEQARTFLISVAAELAGDLGPDSWRRWRAPLDLPPGTHELAVRCRAGDGTVQAGTGRPPYPSGADGFHRVRVKVARA